MSTMQQAIERLRSRVQNAEALASQLTQAVEDTHAALRDVELLVAGQAELEGEGGNGDLDLHTCPAAGDDWAQQALACIAELDDASPLPADSLFGRRLATLRRLVEALSRG